MENKKGIIELWSEMLENKPVMGAVYQSKEIMDILDVTQRRLFSPTPTRLDSPVPYEQELQIKLWYVRKQIEEQEKKEAKKYTSWEIGRIKLNQADFLP